MANYMDDYIQAILNAQGSRAMQNTGGRSPQEVAQMLSGGVAPHATQGGWLGGTPPFVSQGGPVAPAPQQANPIVGSAVAPQRSAVAPPKAAVAPQPAPVRGGPVISAPQPALAPKAPKSPGISGTQSVDPGGAPGMMSAQDILELIGGGGGKQQFAPGQKDFLKEYFNKAKEIFATKAPNYKGNRVAKETGQLDNARAAMNRAGNNIMNPDARYKTAVLQHLDPTNYTTNESRDRYAMPTKIPGVVGNAQGGMGIVGVPGGQRPQQPVGGGGGPLTQAPGSPLPPSLPPGLSAPT